MHQNLRNPSDRLILSHHLNRKWVVNAPTKMGSKTALTTGHVTTGHLPRPGVPLAAEGQQPALRGGTGGAQRAPQEALGEAWEKRPLWDHRHGKPRVCVCVAFCVLF